MPKPFDHTFYCRDLLTNAIDAVKGTMREHDRQRNQGKPTTSADIHDACSLLELHHFRDAEGMQDVPFVEVLEVLARDQVDALVPMGVKLAELRAKCSRCVALSSGK